MAKKGGCSDLSAVREEEEEHIEHNGGEKD
jgi:hypothetical protein